MDEGNICKSNRRAEKAPLFTKYVKHPSYFLDSSLHSLFGLTFSWPDILVGINLFMDQNSSDPSLELIIII